MWGADLGEDIRELFEILVVPDLSSDRENRGSRNDSSAWMGMHTGLPKDVGIRVRRVGRNPERPSGGDPAARREYQRERMRRIRATNPDYGHRKGKT